MKTKYFQSNLKYLDKLKIEDKDRKIQLWGIVHQE